MDMVKYLKRRNTKKMSELFVIDIIAKSLTIIGFLCILFLSLTERGIRMKIPRFVFSGFALVVAISYAWLVVLELFWDVLVFRDALGCCIGWIFIAIATLIQTKLLPMCENNNFSHTTP